MSTARPALNATAAPAGEPMAVSRVNASCGSGSNPAAKACARVTLASARCRRSSGLLATASIAISVMSRPSAGSKRCVASVASGICPVHAQPRDSANQRVVGGQRHLSLRWRCRRRRRTRRRRSRSHGRPASAPVMSRPSVGSKRCAASVASGIRARVHAQPRDSANQRVVGGQRQRAIGGAAGEQRGHQDGCAFHASFWR